MQSGGFQQNAATTEELASTSEELDAQANSLIQAVSYFTVNAKAPETARRSPGRPYPRGRRPDAADKFGRTDDDTGLSLDMKHGDERDFKPYD